MLKKKLFIYIIFIFLNCNKENIETNDSFNPQLIWRTKLSNSYSTDLTLGYMDPIIYKNLVIFSLYKFPDFTTAKLIALNKNTGEKVWEWVNNKTIDLFFESNKGYYIFNNQLIVVISKVLNPSCRY